MNLNLHQHTITIALWEAFCLLSLPPVSLMFPPSRPIDPSLMLKFPHKHTCTYRHICTLTHTDPHPSSTLSLLYLHISTSIGYTCNLATEESEDPPLPAQCANCWTKQPIRLRQGSNKGQSRVRFSWVLQPCSPPF